MTNREIRKLVKAFQKKTMEAPSKLVLDDIDYYRIVSPRGEEYPLTGDELFRVSSLRYDGQYFTVECEFPNGYLGTGYGPLELCYRNIPNYAEFLDSITIDRDIINGGRIFADDDYRETWFRRDREWKFGKTLMTSGMYFCEYHNRYEYDYYAPSIYRAETDDFVGTICRDGIGELGLVRCYECGTYHSRSDVYEFRSSYDGDILLCSSCINDYGECTECGAHAWLNEDNLCRECSNDEAYSYVNDYSFKPRPKFKGLIADSVINGYIGFELEIENNDDEDYDSDDMAYYICHDLNKLVYCKHDGSLDETGIEIVSHPMTLEYLKSCESEFKRCFSALVDDGYRSHNTNNCGLHFHVSRTALGDDDETVEARIIYVIEKFWDELVKFSRRTNYQLDNWAKRNSAINVNDIKGDVDFLSVKNEAKYQKSGGHGQRYHALNVTNRNTIEFRLFRGTLKFETLMASAQLCAAIVKYCVEHNNAEMIECTWDDVAHSTEYEELNNYLATRGL